MADVMVMFMDQHRWEILDGKNLPDHAEPTGRTVRGLEEYVVGTIAEKKAYIDNINMV